MIKFFDFTYMRILFLFFILFLFQVKLVAQFDSLSRFQYDVSLNDVWGYEDELGNEYAIVGLYNGISIVEVSNPNNPVELFRSYGPETVWRDVKVFGDHAYVTNENRNGMRIYNLSVLPYSYTIPNKEFQGGVGKEFETAHNIFIDEKGRAYVVGTDRGGMIIYDLTEDPWNPKEIGFYDQNYIHDIYVENDTAYSAMISDGYFKILDVSNPNSINFISSHPTKDLQTHNTWISDNGNHLFTTDEVNGGEIGVYDISDKTDPEKIERYKSRELGDEMPHNVIIKDSIAFVSYYTDGVIALDVSNPENVLEVDRFDTYKQGSGPGSSGNWGVYPFLKSGNILVSDIENGLYILGYEHKNAGYLEGVVSDKETGFPLNAVKVQVVGGKSDKTYFDGEYKVGEIGTGTITVVFSLSGYKTKTIIVDVVENQITLYDMKLEKLPIGDLIVQLSLQNFETPEGASVSIYGDDYEEELIFDSSTVALQAPQGTYRLNVGKWGYVNECLDYVIDSLRDTVRVNLISGYYDDFSANQDWKVYSVKDDPIWQRVQPKASFGSSGIQQDPSEDATLADCDNWAFCTGINENFSASSTTVNWTNYLVSNEVEVVSPDVDATISFSYWLALSENSLDTVKIGVIQNSDTIYNQNFTKDNEQLKWKKSSFNVSDIIDPSNPFKFIVKVTDDLNPWDLVDFSIDEFSIDFHNNISEFKPNCLVPNINGWKNTCGEKSFLILNSIGQIVRKGRGEKITLRGLKTGVFIIFIEGDKPKKIFWNEL